MQNESEILLQGLGYFSMQHLYTNLLSICMFKDNIFSEESESMDKEGTLAAGQEFYNISCESKKRIDAILNNVPSLHRDDIAYFKEIGKGYDILIKLSELLNNALVDYLYDNDDDLEFNEDGSINYDNDSEVIFNKYNGFANDKIVGFIHSLA